ncbi:eCIS core domain-containing protein [Gaoshiqia sp. Z1-71]|uniref:eCIS core domain-containing protein n=1 Tax=Gaoshiqia hydrogeniformans TaxID=3290090 RepID=UPI003BF90034
MFAPKEKKSASHASSSGLGLTNIPFFQPRLHVGRPGDKYEAEADHIADQVVNHPQTENQTFFSPAVSPAVSSGHSTAVQHKSPAESITPVLQKQEEEETMQMQPVEEDELIQSQSEDEEEIIQQQPTEEENFIAEKTGNVVQKQEEDEDSLQAQPVEEEITGNIEKNDEKLQKKEQEPVQFKSDGNNETPPGFESSLSNSKGNGSPLPGGVKSQMEAGFGADFSQVRVHTGSPAVQMNKAVGAQAFTHGNDIYFNEGKFNPESTSGRHLIAHELTHTVQQGASVQPKMIQKEEDTEGGSGYNRDEFSFSLPNKGQFDVTIPSSDKITISKLPLVPVKVQFHSGSFTRPKNYNRSGQPNDQLDLWKSGLENSSGISSFVESKGIVDANETNILRTPDGNGGRLRRIIGNKPAMQRELTIPSWRSNGRGRWFQVDHKKELQLGGENNLENLWLLNEDSNRNAGFSIQRTIRSIAAKIGEHERDPRNPDVRSSLRNADAVMQNLDMEFQQAVRDAGSSASESPSSWTSDDIRSGNHLSNSVNIQREFLSDLGSARAVMVFPFAAGGVGKRFNNNESVVRDERLWLNPWVITAKSFNTDDGSEQTPTLGTFQIELKNNPVAEAVASETLAINRFSGAQFAGYIEVDKFFLQQYALDGFGIKKFSPVEFNSARFDDANGITINGKVNPTLGLIEDCSLDLLIRNGDIRVSKTFTAGDFNFPSPFEIRESSLTLFLSITDGLGIEGRVDFGIDHVGEGHIGAAASTSGGFELEGAFNFDSELFDPARINVEYKDNIWTIGGTIGIPEGKIRGVKNATITATYSENTFSASGEAELDIPGIRRGNMEVTYSNEGFSIGGEFQLSEDIPGIRSGSVSATISKQNGEEGYNVRVSGTAEPDIPGVDSSLTVTYDNGALTIEGSAAYSRGMLSGTVNIGATNRTIGDDGQPSGDPDDTMRVYGGGSLTLTLTPWLQATAGVNFLPNGEIEVTGRIGLPSSVDVFDRRSIDRNLFTVPAIEIPIFAIPIGPRSIGLVARITGGLDFSAGFGPGQLRDLYADVTYNPDREEETTITGHGEFAIPADAGLTLRGDLGLGVSVGIASLTGGIEIAGTLGLEGEAAAEVDVNWSPQTGLALDATGRITVNPKFTFDINAFARASLDLWVKTISKTWRYNLVSFSWGPDIQFGIVFPVHYREGEPFDMSFDDIEVIYPDLDVVEMAKGLARDIKDRIFD